jgi:fatty acid desaturase
MSERFRKLPPVEWQTLLLVVLCYGFWAINVFWLASLSLMLAIPLTALSVTLHSSLQHEILHGHPTRWRRVNEALVFLPVGLLFPYGRFRDTHLAHHRDEILTDPYDDPETNFQDPAVWARMSRPYQLLLRFNNTLFGRMLIGPAVGGICFIRGDIAAIRAGDRAILRDWLIHGAGLAVLVLIVRQSAMPAWAYVLSAYAGLSILKIRTYLEHRAHEIARGRSVIIPGGRILPFLFLNNNLHAVHHARPGVAWYLLPALYRERRDEFLRRNDGYQFASYVEVFRRYFFRAKDPVPHPLWPRSRD